MKDIRFLGFLRAAGALALTTLSCCDPQVNQAEFADMEVTTALLPASPTNAFADDPAAAALGRRLFFDQGFSSEGTVACVSCHDPAQGFSDPRARSVGVRGQLGGHHAMPVTAAVLHPFLLWDGHADSAWLQPLKALENTKEMDFTRVEVARRMNDAYRVDYEGIFGPIPDLSTAPPRAMPGDDAWTQMPESLQNDVQRVFVNVGKAIEAYERKLLCTDTRFDKWLRGEVQLSSAELSGAATFDDQHCARCHSGPSFSDGRFHNIGIPSSDRGRALGAPSLMADPFNGASAYSDDPAAGGLKLALVSSETVQEGTFRTASLRGVGQRTFFGHAAHKKTLSGFLLDVYRGRRRRGNDDGAGAAAAAVGRLDPDLDDVHLDDEDVDDLIAFLHTLDCPAPPPELLAPDTAP